jgi:hypothetical protein
MKELLLAFVLLSSTSIGQAQDKKPSKTETIQFIKNFLELRTEYVWISG